MAMRTASDAPSLWIKAALLPPKTDPSPSLLPFQTFVTFCAVQLFNAIPPSSSILLRHTILSASSGGLFSMYCQGFHSQDEGVSEFQEFS